YSQAADAGNVSGTIYLGRMYHSGDRWLRIERHRAEQLYERAAQIGPAALEATAAERDSSACFLLARMYHYGHCGVPKDWSKVPHLLGVATELGHEIAQANLGHKYYHGMGV